MALWPERPEPPQVDDSAGADTSQAAQSQYRSNFQASHQIQQQDLRRLPLTDYQICFLRTLLRLLSDLFGCPHAENVDYKLHIIKSRIAEDEAGFRRLCAIIGACKLSKDAMPRAQLPGAASAGDIKAICDALVTLSIDQLKKSNKRTVHFTLLPKAARSQEQDEMEQSELFEYLGLGRAADAADMCKRSLQELLHNADEARAHTLLQLREVPTAESVAGAVRRLAAPVEHLSSPAALALLGPHIEELNTIAGRLQQVQGQNMNHVWRRRAPSSASEPAQQQNQHVLEQTNTRMWDDGGLPPVGSVGEAATIGGGDEVAPWWVLDYGGITSEESASFGAMSSPVRVPAGAPPSNYNVHAQHGAEPDAQHMAHSSREQAQVLPPQHVTRHHLAGPIDNSVFNLPPHTHAPAEASSSQSWLSPRASASGTTTNADNVLQLQSDEQLARDFQFFEDGDDDNFGA